MRPTDKRLEFRRRIDSGELTVLPGVFNALSAQAAASAGAHGIYVSGHMIAADLGLPDIGLTTITEVATRAHQIARVVDAPTIVDADTGFGEPANAARSVQALEDSGLAGCHIEDQINPKRCGHSEGVDVVDADIALRRIRAAALGRRWDEFVLIARTDARAAIGVDAAIERAKAFVDAGADVIFPEALRTRDEYRQFRREIEAPLMINLNEFGGRTPLTQQEVRDLGYEVAIYPMTLMRLAMGAVTEGIRQLLDDGSQHEMLDRMQPRDELYSLLDYDGHERFDRTVIG